MDRLIDRWVCMYVAKWGLTKFHFLTLRAEWMLMVICRHRNIHWIDRTSKKRVVRVVGFHSSGIWTACSEREAEGRNIQRNPLTQLPLQKHGEGRQDHEGLKGTERPRVSLCVAVWNGAWKTGMLTPSCALRPGTPVRLRGTLAKGPPGNASNSQPERAHQIDTKLSFDR